MSRAAGTGTREELAQYFTPPAVVDFALEALAALGMRPPRRIIDPACGEGVFLRHARKRYPDGKLWGCDMDEGLKNRWEHAGLTPPAARMIVQDGLHDAPWYGLVSDGFDLAVGNPPYGFAVQQATGGERIEARFLKRFVELLAPGGWMAVVLPEGVLANARSQGLRDGLLRRLRLEAVVALPECTFSGSGTRARTALLVARKTTDRNGSTVLIEPQGGDGGLLPLRRYLRDAAAVLRDGASRAPAE